MPSNRLAFLAVAAACIVAAAAGGYYAARPAAPVATPGVVAVSADSSSTAGAVPVQETEGVVGDVTASKTPASNDSGNGQPRTRRPEAVRVPPAASTGGKP